MLVCNENMEWYQKQNLPAMHSELRLPLKANPREAVESSYTSCSYVLCLLHLTHAILA